MVGFSWKKAIIKADANILRQAKTVAKKGEQQAKLDHPDEVRDANQGNYTKLIIRIKDETAKHRKGVLARRELLGNQQT